MQHPESDTQQPAHNPLFEGVFQTDSAADQFAAPVAATQTDDAFRPASPDEPRFTPTDEGTPYIPVVNGAPVDATDSDPSGAGTAANVSDPNPAGQHAEETGADHASDTESTPAPDTPAGRESPSDPDPLPASATAASETMMREVVERLDRLDAKFAKRLQYDDEKEKVIDRQHAELLKLREGLLHESLRPMLRHFAQVLNDVIKTREDLERNDRDPDGDVIEALKDVEFNLTGALEANDVEQVRSSQGDARDPMKHQLLRKLESTDDLSLDRAIARSVAPGYTYGSMMLLKEQVIAYKYVPKSGEGD